MQAFRDPEIDMILCAIGGDDTYRLLPYLFDHHELAKGVSDKVFLGFSDTTVNHLMLHKVGLNTFYGQAFLPDICELSQEMHDYTRKYFEELISTGTIKEITPSDVWYEERKSITPDQVGKPLIFMDWVIYRPTGYFYDIAKVFAPYVEKGEMQLLKGYGGVKANVVDCEDFAAFIVQHMNDSGVTYNIGGKEIYTYEKMAEMCFQAAGKPCKIKWAPIWLFGILANLPKIKKAGKHDIILFSKWTLSHDLVGDIMIGDKSFAEYLKNYFGKERKQQ